ncbi:uncharacterized protein LOC144773827 [Lissotriton helveticus]
MVVILLLAEEYKRKGVFRLDKNSGWLTKLTAKNELLSYHLEKSEIQKLENNQGWRAQLAIQNQFSPQEGDASVGPDRSGLLLNETLSLLLSSGPVAQQVSETLRPLPEGPGHRLEPGQWVLVKNYQRKSSLEPKWSEPYQIILAIRSAVKVHGHKHCIHASHLKRLPLPLPFDLQNREGISNQEGELLQSFVPFSEAREEGQPSEAEPPADRAVNQSSEASVSGASQGSNASDARETELFDDQELAGRCNYDLRPRKQRGTPDSHGRS